MGSTSIFFFFFFFFNAWNKKVQSLHAPLVSRLVSIFFSEVLNLWNSWHRAGNTLGRIPVPNRPDQYTNTDTFTVLSLFKLHVLRLWDGAQTKSRARGSAQSPKRTQLANRRGTGNFMFAGSGENSPVVMLKQAGITTSPWEKDGAM